MKKIAMVFFAAVLMLALSAPAMAASITLKSDLVKIDGSESFLRESLWVYGKKGSIGGGINITSVPKTHFLDIQALATIDVDEGISVVGGIQTNSAGSSHVLTGLWLNKNIDKIKIIADLRQWWTLEGECYSDNFLEISIPVSEKISLAGDFVHDHWWTKENHDWFLAGPVIYYKAAKNTTLFFRPALEWDIKDNKTTRGNDFRIGITVKF